MKKVVKARVVNVLMNFELTKEEISTLSKIPKYDMVTTNATSKKRSTDDQPKVPVEDINNQITFPVFDLSTKKSVLEIPLIVSQLSHTRFNATPITALY